ncbi:hypothetical protein SEPCBS57363_005784 [Sporothrix epigloea]|uniref:Septin-type G domain-containing protein n=1 Tax=Sporothrix epigloea TaxID=1892477 RepID=A0ABP0DZG2_9PEZI
MRPSDAFGRQRPVESADFDALATPLASGVSGTCDSNYHDGSVVASGGSNSPPALGINGAGLTAAPMMSYFLTDEASVDAAMDAASRDPESFRTALQHARHFYGKRQLAHPEHAVPAHPIGMTPTSSHDEVKDTRPTDDVNKEALNPISEAQQQQQQARHCHTHSTNTLASHPSSLPPNFSPLFSQSGSTSLFGTPGPDSLSAMSSPSSRRDSLSGSLTMDDSIISCGGDVLTSHQANFDTARGLGIGGSTLGADASSATGHSSGLSALESKEAFRNVSANAASRHLSASVAGILTTDSSMIDSGSAPHLVMPSIKMLSRRPFTEEGKNMGRLKVLLAGESGKYTSHSLFNTTSSLASDVKAGLGKTSLIKAIVQSCQHIVHVDNIMPPSLSSSGLSSIGPRRSSEAFTGSANVPNGGQNTIRARRKSSRSTQPDTTTNHITEIYASTKPYPKWWSVLANEGGSRRRKSLGDNVLDRNICFVDTPGFTRSTSATDSIMPVIEYVEGFVQKLCTSSLNDTDFVGLLSGDGGTAVDVVFYLLAENLQPTDIDFLRLLTSLTCVIPLLARADTLPTETDVAKTKDKISRRLHEADIQPFVFTAPDIFPDSANTQASSSAFPLPYAISSANGSDHDIMDASLLMSPDYVQPLVPTDLATLVEQVFCPEGISRLRHSTALKISQWRQSFSSVNSSNNEASGPQALYRPLDFGSNEHSHLPVSLSGAAAARTGVRTTPLGAPLSFALARITDHTQREEHLAQIRLSSWAAELQRKLDSERARYETLARNERAVWLTERLTECVRDGTLIAVPPAARSLERQQQEQGLALAKVHKKKAKGAWSAAATSVSSLTLPRPVFSPEDPLGLLEVTAELRARGVVMLEVLGSLSVLGGMALWLIRHNYHLQVCEWATCEWLKLRYGLR